MALDSFGTSNSWRQSTAVSTLGDKTRQADFRDILRIRKDLKKHGSLGFKVLMKLIFKDAPMRISVTVVKKPKSINYAKRPKTIFLHCGVKGIPQSTTKCNQTRVINTMASIQT